MTISSTTNRVSYAGDGGTTVFSYPHRFLEDDDLLVIVVDDGTGVETEQTLDTDYTVSGAGDAGGGDVTFTSAPASGKTIVILNDPDITQGYDPEDGSALAANSLETAFDRLTLINQRQSDQIGRAFRKSDGDTSGAATVLPVPIENRSFKYVSDGNGGLELGLTSHDPDEAQEDAEAAQTAAETAQSAAETAQSAAEDARDTTIAAWPDPENATDSGTDTYVSETTTTPPNETETIRRDFQSASTTTTPELDSLTITTRDGSALWAGALSGVHELQLASGGGPWLVLDPNPVAANSANAGVQRDANGRAKFADPSAAQDAATYGVLGSEYLGTLAASSSATLESTAGFDDSQYSAILYVFSNILPATDSVDLRYRLSTDGGITFDSGVNYTSVGLGWSGTATTGSDNTGNSGGFISFGGAISNAGQEGLKGTLIVTPAAKSGEQSTGLAHATWTTPSDGGAIATRASQYTGGNAPNAIQFSMSSGNIASGEIHIYGLRK